MQIQIFHRNDSNYYDLKTRLVTYLMIVMISLKEICLRCLQPTELKDEQLEINSPATGYPIVTSLMSSKQKMKSRKLVFVL